MSGSAKSHDRDEPKTIWYDLVDLETDRVVGQVTRRGRVRSDNPDVERSVYEAFHREVLTHDGAIVEELGVCFDGVVTVEHDDNLHHDLVFRNLGLLTGLIPRQP